MDSPPPSPEQVVQRLEARRRAVRGFEMQGQIEIVTPQGELYGDHLIQGANPHRLRAEVLGPFGRPALALASDGVLLTVLDYRNNQAFRGPATRSNLARFLGMYLSMTEIYALLTGNAPLYPAHRVKTAPSPRPGRGLLSLLPQGGVGGLNVEFSLGDYRVNEAWLRQWPGGVEMTCRFSDFARFPAGAYPRKIRLSDDNQRSIAISNDRLTINQPLDASRFELQLPPDLPVHPLP
jgi:hypothetical protein